MKTVFLYACWLMVAALFMACGSSSNNGSSTTATQPHAEVAPAALNFGDISIGKTGTLVLSITNQGKAPLDIYGMALDQDTSPEFAIVGEIADLIVEAGASTEVEVTYSPMDAGQDAGTLRLDCNDGTTPRITVSLSGSGALSNPANPAAYEGFGAVTLGAESSPTGYDTYHVTSLDDSGPATLRDALSQGRRRVVFDVGGTIVLQNDLNIPHSYVTIDGASAPFPGITIEQPGNIQTTIEARSRIGPAHDIIIRHLRMDGMATGHTNDGDIWGLDGESAPVYNIILDHITAIASTDGVFDIWEEVRDVTLSWNLILDTITACHLSTGDLSKIRQRISIHHNVFARNNERQIRLRHNNRQIDFVNNVIYGWGWMESGAAGLHIAHDSGEINPSINVINNLYHDVPNLNDTPDRAVIFERGDMEGNVYFNGNRFPAQENDAISTSGPLDIPAAAKVTLYPVDTLHSMVVPHVGTQYPTAEERQLLDEIQQAIVN